MYRSVSTATIFFGVLLSFVFFSYFPASALDAEAPADAKADQFRRASGGQAFSFSILDSVVGLANKISNGRLVQSLVRPDALSYEYADQIWSIADRWTRTSLSGGATKVNQLYNEKAINIYVVRKQFLIDNGYDGLQSLCPCEYLPETSSIVCVDEALKKTFHYLDPRTEDALVSKDEVLREGAEGVRELHRTFMAQWVIAHELGHAVYRHSFHDLQKAWMYQDTPIGLNAEKEADSFYITRLSHDEKAQAAAQMGLSQLMTSLYYNALQQQYGGDEGMREKNIRVFAADSQVDLPYDPGRHPPSLVRAVTLYQTLLDSYPNMLDASGYVSRIAKQIRPKAAKNLESSEFCSAGASREGPEPLKTLRTYFEIYLYEGEKTWALNVMERVRRGVAEISNEPKKDLWSIILEIMIQKYSFKFDNKAPEWSSIQRRIASLRSDLKPIADLYLEAGMAFTGQLTQEAATADLQNIQDQINGLLDKHLLDQNSDLSLASGFDLLSNYLIINFVPSTPSEDQSNYASRLLGVITERFSDNALDRDLLVEILQAQAVDVLKVGIDKKSPKDMLAAKIMALRIFGDLADVARDFSWDGREGALREFELRRLEEWLPDDHQVIANRARTLALLDVRYRYFRAAVKLLQEADDHILTLKGVIKGEKDQAALNEWHLKVQNDIGWAFLSGGYFADASATLENVREQRERGQDLLRICIRWDDSDRELASVYQNLADARLGLGDFQSALLYAMKAQFCRDRKSADLKLTKELLESKKTRGIALYYLGNKEESLAYLEEFISSIITLVDYSDLPQEAISFSIGDNKILFRDIIPNYDELVKHALERGRAFDANESHEQGDKK